MDAATGVCDVFRNGVCDKRRLVAWGIQVNEKTGRSAEPAVEFSKRHLYCSECGCDIQQELCSPELQIKGFTPIQDNFPMASNPAIKIGFITVRCPWCGRLSSSLLNCDGYCIVALKFGLTAA